MARSRLIAAVPTPLGDEFHIATAPLARHCDLVLSSGCDAVVLFGTTGEGTFFSPAEKLAAVRGLKAEGLDPARIIVATGTCALDDVAEIVRGAQQLGCAATLVLPPFFTKEIDEEGLAGWFDALIARAGPGARIYLYHIPAIAGVGFSANFVLDQAARRPENICGFKDSTAELGVAQALANAGFKFAYISSEIGLADYLAIGMAGTISGSLNVTLPLVCKALRGSKEADRAVAAIRAHLTKPSLIWGVKAALYAATGDAAWSRLAPPHRPPAHISTRDFLDRLEILRAAVPA